MDKSGSFLKELDFPLFIIILFLFTDYVRPIIFAKLKVALILQVVMIIFLIKSNIFVKIKQDQYRNQFFILYLLLMLEMLLHIFIATNNFWAFQNFKSTVSYFLFFLMVSVYVDSYNKLKIVLFSFILFNLYLAFMGISAGGKVSGNGFMADENDFALAMNMALPIALFLTINLKGIWRIGLLPSVIVFFFAGAFSLSRGGMVGIMVVGFMIWLNSKKKILSLLILIVFVAFFIPSLPEGYKSEFMSIFEEGSSSGTGLERIEFWKVSTKMFLSNPIFGVGQGNIPFRLHEFQKGGIWERGIGGRAVHSFYFTLLPELGLFGTIIVILMIKQFFKIPMILKNESLEVLNYVKGIKIGMIAFLITGIFLSVLYYPHFWILLPFMNICYVNRSEIEGNA